MSGKLIPILQDEVLGQTNPFPALEAAGYAPQRFSAAGGWRDYLRERDRLSAALRARSVVFCSLEAARFIRRACPALARGLILEPDLLQAHMASTLLPAEMLLNRSFILLPFHALEMRINQIRTLFGSRIFLRPNSAMKAFPGQCLSLDELPAGISMIRQVFRPDEDLMVFLDRARAIRRYEFRCWLIAGRVAAIAPYAFGPGGVDPLHPAPACPAALRALAERVAARLEDWDDMVVADFAMEIGGCVGEPDIPRLVEMNAVSTSGHYPGMDLIALLEAIDPMILPLS